MSDRGKQQRRYAPTVVPSTTGPELLAWLATELRMIAAAMSRIEDELAKKQDKT
jgi:hypothetical protein